MTAHEPDDDAPDKSPGTTRRSFLGAASALGALAATGTSTATTDDQDFVGFDEPEADTYDDDLTFSAGLQLYNLYNNPAEYELQPSKLEDEKVALGLEIRFDKGDVSLAFTREEGEAFIERFEDALERGDKGLGKRDQ